ncbi:SGNH/GDSL hydrolase family protein [Ichthyenterobacterium sp. W332]|uniref:SGNH/GDSL hydrolase family protein n=1 Tax=Microcosmobacter mediterraneus TaxID=3075607 RepID=A0ABU2YMV7_9FLAO|nr:SGNH/GDSL hydrolase family protein [Ichthyenterobacterium sp. W332]MDT0558610.1 SGNH/GDSL hydrolase family protein [Ichthyenterobacterium sp. W332]
MKRLLFILGLVLGILSFTCSSSENSTIEDPFVNINEEIENNTFPEPKNFRLLALGDSYTIGTAVCETCRYPEQLKDSLVTYFNEDDTFSLDIVAQGGWTTTQLIGAVNSTDLLEEYDLVTLLIGVNNQFQGKPFITYQLEFPELVGMATTLAEGDANRIIIISIPDYAMTPFGMAFDDGNIASEIDMYNNYASTYAEQAGITFINVTDISRTILEFPELIAEDGLHPSELAYSKYVERILPAALEKLGYEAD